MKGASERVVKAFAFSAATMLPVVGGGLNQDEPLTFTTQELLSEGEKSLGVEEVVPEVVCDFPDWFRERMEIPGTTVTLRFLRRPQMTLHGGQCFAIPDWGVRIPLVGISANEIRLAVVRAFLRLHRAAQNGFLPDEDRRSWENLVRDVDYAGYCEQVAPPVWSVGTKVKTTDEGVVVAWSSVDHETLVGDFAKQMSVVEDGARFSALTSFVDYKLSALSNVAQLGPYSAADDDVSWLS